MKRKPSRSNGNASKIPELLGRDLAGWRLEEWTQLWIVPGKLARREVIGYFTDNTLANLAGKGAGNYRSDAHPSRVVVLTKDGRTGFLLNTDGVKQPIELSDKDSICKQQIQYAKSLLPPELWQLLSIPD